MSSNNTPTTPRIALIHAVYVAMAPVEAAFLQRWPEANRFNLIDDGLSPDLERQGMTEAMVARIRRLADHAVGAGADGILFTCSAFGSAIEAAAAAIDVPLLKPNEAMFEAALVQGRRIGMLATFPSSVASMEEEFAELARSRGVDATLETVCVPEALVAAKAGDIASHDRLVAEAAPRLAYCDAVMLAHFSTSTALEPVRARLRCPVLTAPGAAVDALRTRCAPKS